MHPEWVDDLPISNGDLPAFRYVSWSQRVFKILSHQRRVNKNFQEFQVDESRTWSAAGCDKNDTPFPFSCERGSRQSNPKNELTLSLRQHKKTQHLRPFERPEMAGLMFLLRLWIFSLYLHQEIWSKNVNPTNQQNFMLFNWEGPIWSKRNIFINIQRYRISLPETNIFALKMDDRNTIVSFRGGLFSGGNSWF